MAVTLRASQAGLNKVDMARRKKGWSKTESVWCELTVISASTLKRFWSGQAIQQEAFVAICEAVGINNWQEIVEETNEQSLSQDSSDIVIVAADYVPHSQENRCPDCLFLYLEGVMVKSASLQQVELRLTINFNEQWEDLGIGRVKFGIRSGELRLSLTNGKIPYSSRKLATTDCYISTKGSEEKPVWEFKLKKTDEPTLKVLLDAVKLAILQTTAIPANLEATFEISLNDLFLTDIEEILPPATHINKQIAIKAEVVRWMLQSKVKPYMSRLEMKYA
ncbi:MAG: hypothetical protein KME15_16645 [Drouetiella hepatica Uher 2000/2452]|jgi:hypothetical protein|uniref:Uncharacterized protein n=1 Tax=Drouetiella hepatica Uher 2000/2452 TaxID=904376 RepID=A0A951UNB4_9CYAN|nr:hypothetical protein [Drouetiella hepatica Uher 2000/2452]